MFGVAWWEEEFHAETHERRSRPRTVCFRVNLVVTLCEKRVESYEGLGSERKKSGRRGGQKIR